MTEKYQIQIQGTIGERWTGWFDGMAITSGQGSDGSQVTTLTGTIVDQSALRGILAMLWDLNLTLISVTRVEMDTE